jgi:hypothetical protein
MIMKESGADVAFGVFQVAGPNPKGQTFLARQSNIAPWQFQIRGACPRFVPRRFLRSRISPKKFPEFRAKSPELSPGFSLVLQ